jgi:hypothetical protein
MKRICFLAILSISAVALAQQASPPAAVPFFFAGGTTTDAQISIAASGDSLSVSQGVVSHDRKYVTLHMAPQMNSISSIQPFVVSKASPAGFVGSATAIRSAAPAPKSAFDAGGARNSLTPSIGVLPSDVALAKITVLDQPGMTQVAHLP